MRKPSAIVSLSLAALFSVSLQSSCTGQGKNVVGEWTGTIERVGCEAWSGYEKSSKVDKIELVFEKDGSFRLKGKDGADGYDPSFEGRWKMEGNALSWGKGEEYAVHPKVVDLNEKALVLELERSELATGCSEKWTLLRDGK